MADDAEFVMVSSTETTPEVDTQKMAESPSRSRASSHSTEGTNEHVAESVEVQTPDVPNPTPASLSSSTINTVSAPAAAASSAAATPARATATSTVAAAPAASSTTTTTTTVPVTHPVLIPGGASPAACPFLSNTSPTTSCCSCESLLNILEWKHVPCSAGVFVAHLLFIYWFFIADHTLIAATTSLLLYTIALSGVYFGIYKGVNYVLPGKLPDLHRTLLPATLHIPKEAIIGEVDCLVNHIEYSYEYIRQVLTFSNPIQSAKVFGILFAVKLIGSCFTVGTLLVIVHFVAFIVPRLYKEKKTDIDAQLAKANAKIHEVVALVETKANSLLGRKNKKD